MSSITGKWILTITTLITMAIGMILIANTLFLESFYARKNKSLFLTEYEDLKKSFVQPDGEILDILREKDRRTGFLFYIAEEDNSRPLQIVLTSIPNFFPPDISMGGMDSMPRLDPPRAELPKEQIDFILEYIEMQGEDEEIFGKVERAATKNNEFDLVFAAHLNPPYYLIIVRPVEQLSEHAAIANQFMLIIGLLTLLISIIIARASAKSIVKPIKEITKIGEHIANLDFSHRYTGCARDEIGHLGNSINRISTQLDKAMKELEDTNNKLQKEMNLQKRFFAGVSHEFKTPVGLIRGYSESLKLGLAGSPEEIQEFSTIIMEETDRLNHLITDILFLVKSESAEFVLNMKKLDLVPLMASSLEASLPLILDREIRIEKNQPGEALARGDRIRIRQIIDNLLANALRHTPRGGRILMEILSDAQGITCRIRNEGEAIPEEHLAHLFKPFYSAYESRDKATTGTGLGLSIVRNLVEKHGGIFGIENSRDEDFPGVTAWFRLPRV